MTVDILRAESFWDLMLSAGWNAGCLAVMVIVIELLFGRWLAPKYRRILWLMVAVRLILPIAPSSSLSMLNVFGACPFTQTTETDTLAADSTELSSITFWAPPTEYDGHVVDASPPLAGDVAANIAAPVSFVGVVRWCHVLAVGNRCHADCFMDDLGHLAIHTLHSQASLLRGPVFIEPARHLS
jgi:beta-lactamase regulating signal transducer with metallopeptidase domain